LRVDSDSCGSASRGRHARLLSWGLLSCNLSNVIHLMPSRLLGSQHPLSLQPCARTVDHKGAHEGLA
jgi:hypothetical protein